MMTGQTKGNAAWLIKQGFLECTKTVGRFEEDRVVLKSTTSAPIFIDDFQVLLGPA